MNPFPYNLFGGVSEVSDNLLTEVVKFAWHGLKVNAVTNSGERFYLIVFRQQRV